MERRASHESLVELIDSGQFLVAEEIFSERRTDEPMEMVIRSEVASYFDRYEDAAALLDQVGPRIADIKIAARFSLTKGSLALLQADWAQAATQLQSAYHFYLFLNDSFGISRALLSLARFSRIRGDQHDATLKLEVAQNGISGRNSKRTEYLRGIILTEQAAVAIEQGDVERANELFAEAARTLRNTEKGRAYALAVLGTAELKCSMGEFQDSLELYKEANTVLERYDLRRVLAESNLKLAKALIRLNRLERAEKLSEESKDLQRGNPAGESDALSTLAIVLLQKNEMEKSARLAQEAVELADKTPFAEPRARARLALGLVRISNREFSEATAALREAADISKNAVGSVARRLELESTIYLAEAFHNTDTRAGRNELIRASELLNNVDDAWLGDEFNRVSAKYEEQIVFTDDNRLVFDGNQLPRWQEAKRTLEGFLLRNALRQTNNSLTRAARKLGVSKVHVHNLKKKHGI